MYTVFIFHIPQNPQSIDLFLPLKSMLVAYNSMPVVYQFNLYLACLKSDEIYLINIMIVSSALPAKLLER